MRDKRQIWFRNILAGLFFLLLAAPAILKHLHHHDHQAHYIDKEGCRIEAVCAVCEAPYTQVSFALPVPAGESIVPHFFEIFLLHPHTVAWPQRAFIPYGPGRAPPFAA